ncbi:MAG: ankyrin repeat domain-containing protein [Nitrospirae bacterium]|nr:ankyrin repeat domain-containing protein [Nitrospirota bacterium]
MKEAVWNIISGLLLLAVLGGCAVPLLNAAASGDTKKVLQLLERGHHANEEFPIVGTRPLTLAAAHGNADTVRALLEAGAEVNAVDFTGWTALHAAAFKGDVETVSLLLKYRAVSGQEGWFLQSPLKIAEMLQHKDVAALLQKTASPPSDGETRPLE